MTFLEANKSFSIIHRASLVAQRLKRLPPMRETRVRSLGQEDPLEKEMVTHSSILAWRIPWTEEPSRLQLDTTEQLHSSLSTLHSKVRKCIRFVLGSQL